MIIFIVFWIVTGILAAWMYDKMDETMTGTKLDSLQWFGFIISGTFGLCVSILTFFAFIDFLIPPISQYFKQLFNNSHQK